MRTRLVIPLGLLSLLALGSAPAAADDVYLTNGRSFKGVIADEGEAQVRIRMPGGELSLPRTQVARVEKSESSYAEYLRRRQAMGREAGAGEWLVLARWAKAQGLEHGAREAALAAAVLDPHLAGLAPLLRGYGYVLDEQLDRWIPYADAMRRRGFVQANGQWISREEQAERLRARDDEAQRRAVRDAAEAAAAASRAQRALAEMTLYRETVRETAPAPAYAYDSPVVVWPGYFLPPVVPVPSPSPHPRPGGPWNDGGPHHQRNGYDRFVNRQPGSLLPLGWPNVSSGH